MLRVMLIDDEASVLVGLRLLVDWEKHGSEICGAFQHPDEALRAAETLRPDLIITDIEMPEISGLDLILSLHTICPQAVCVILSAYSDFRYAQYAVELGVYRYLLKPLAEEELALLLDDVRRQKRSVGATEESLLIKTLVVKEILLNGTELPNICSLSALQELGAERSFRLLFLRDVEERVLSAMRQRFPEVIWFPCGDEIVVLCSGLEANELLEAMQLNQCLNAELSEPFVGLHAGHELLRHRQAGMPQDKNESADELLGDSQEVVQRAMAYIQQHYMEHDFRLSNMAEAFYMNNSYISHVFKQKTGTTLYQYLLDLRMREAKKLLASSQMTVAEIGYQVGYAIPKNFYSAFKKYYNESPRSYQKRNINRP